MNEITEDDIHEKLSQHYGTGMDRELIRNARQDSYGSIGSVVYSLNGSPPKGYAIVIPNIRQVSLYDNKGERFRILKETTVAEVTELMERDREGRLNDGQDSDGEEGA